MAVEEFENNGSSERSRARLKFGIARLNEALEMLDGAGVPLAASYVHLAIHLCVNELKNRPV
jgi:hypothetical protein